MKRRWLALLTLWAAPFASDRCPAQEAAVGSTSPAPAASTSAWHPDDRLTLTAQGATLSNTNGGGGGSVGYLHELTPDVLVGVGAEYQSLYIARWAFGSLNAAFSHALTATTRWSVSGEIHEGTGRSGNGSFPYAIEAIGVGATVPGGLAVNLEERQIDVAADHGSLPKVGLSKAWGTRWLTTVAYAHSVGGNLNTNYTLVRVDYYGGYVNLLAGGSVGRVNPVVISIDGLLEGTTRHLNEVFVGVTKPFGRFDLTLLADDIDLAGSKHFVGTLSGTLHFH